MSEREAIVASVLEFEDKARQFQENADRSQRFADFYVRLANKVRDHLKGTDHDQTI